MQYMLIFRETEADFAKRSHPQTGPLHMGAWASYIDAMVEAGVLIKGDGLMPPQTATTVRIRDGKRDVQDGPYADVKELLGGYVVIESGQLDDAIEWAAKAPAAASASVEIRPVLPPPS